MSMSLEDQNYDNCFPWYIPDHRKEGLKEFIAERSFTRVGNSPDALDLNCYKYHLLFSYGLDKQGKSESKHLKNSKFLCRGITVQSEFTLLQSKNLEHNASVVAFQGWPKTLTKARIHGEVYLVSTSVLLDLDFLRDNTAWTHRKKIKVFTANPYTNHVLHCWTYLGDSEEPQLGLYESAPLFKRKVTGELYYFFHGAKKKDV